MYHSSSLSGHRVLVQSLHVLYRSAYHALALRYTAVCTRRVTVSARGPPLRFSFTFKR